MFFLISLTFSFLGVLLSIAFFTLVERKIMGLMHYRKAPNKIIFMGVMQPISDATKLLLKEFCKIQSMKNFLYWVTPLMGLFLMLLCWGFYESCFLTVINKMKIFSIMSILSLMVFIFLMTSWGSNSKYSILGGFRAISQVISYEVCLMIFILIISYNMKTYNMKIINLNQENFSFWMFMPLMFLMWVMMCMAESNRTPFDLAEGESEIVSGFNIEYGGGLFALIFIMEYGMIMFMSFFTSLIFFSKSFLILKTFLLCFIYIWTRCCFPRLRFNNLMMLCWKISLPYSLCLLSLMCLFMI